MTRTKIKPYQHPSQSWKVWLLLLVITGLGAAGYSTWKQYANGLPREAAPRGVAGGSIDPMGPPRPAQMRANMEVTMAQLNMTEAQKTQVRGLWKSGVPGTINGMRTRIEALRKVATPEQQAQFTAMAQNRWMQRMAELQKKLPPEDFAALQTRVQRIRTRVGADAPATTKS